MAYCQSSIVSHLTLNEGVLIVIYRFKYTLIFSNFIMSTFFDIIHFYRKPYINIHKGIPCGKKIVFLISLMLKCYLCILAFLLIYTCSLSFIDSTILGELSNGVGNSLDQLGKYALLYGAFIGPLCEEILFRLPLNMKKTNILLSLFIALLYTYAAIFSRGYISIPVFLIITSLLIYIFLTIHGSNKIPNI